MDLFEITDDKRNENKGGINSVNESYHYNEEDREKSENLVKDTLTDETKCESYKKRSRSRSHKKSTKSLKKRSKSRSHNKSTRSHKKRSRSKSHKKSTQLHKKRSRSRSHKKSTRSHKERSRSRKNRSKSRSMRRKSRSSSRSYRKRVSPRHRERRRSRNRGEDNRRRRSDSRTRCYASDVNEIQKQLTDDEKDARTVYVWQLSQRVRTRDLEDLFSKIGKLCIVRLILDPRSGKSKGVAYIQYRDVESVDKALGLNGTKLCGFAIMVRTVSSEKCRAAEATTGGGGINLKGPTKLCISNLHQIITKQNLEEIFSPYGLIKEIQLLSDISGNSSGTAFITFHRGEHAKMAMDQLNNFLLANMNMKISPVTESNFGSELNESMGVSMSSSARLGLMAKLAVGTGLQMTPAIQNEEKAVLSTQCFVLTNMFELDDIKDEESCKEIEEDIIAECAKFGGILHIYLDKRCPTGNVYIKCPTLPISSQCVNSMHGRSFDGRTITAAYIPLTNYNQLFPESAQSTKILV